MRRRARCSIRMYLHPQHLFIPVHECGHPGEHPPYGNLSRSTQSNPMETFRFRTLQNL